VLSDYSGQAKYAEAADAELKFFLEHTASPETHLLPWGEHMFWNVMMDEPDPADGEHEFSRPWMLWERCFKVAPEASRRFAMGLWEHQIADHKTGGYDRHAPFAKHGPRSGMDFPRHGGFYIRTWAEAYAHTKDGVFLQAIDTLLMRFEKKRDPKTGLIEATTRNKNLLGQPLAGHRLRRRIAQSARPAGLASPRVCRREDEAFVSLRHDLKEKQGFVMAIDRETGQTERGLHAAVGRPLRGSTTLRPP